MNAAAQQIRFCRSRDGTRIAFAISGEGPSLLWVGHFSRHLEYDWTNPVWSPWLSYLTAKFRVIRYDIRGCGLSDRKVDISLDRLSEDLEAVIDAVAPPPFAFFGTAGNVVAGVQYAVTHPERVSRLILYGCHTRGPLVRETSPEEKAEAETRLKAIELGWANRNAAFGNFFAALHTADAPAHYAKKYAELLRISTSPETATGLIQAYWQADLRLLAPHVRCPSLVLHMRDDPVIPFEEGRLAASLIPGAWFVPLQGRNHLIVDTDPAWKQFKMAFENFMAHRDGSSENLAELTPREREVLTFVARGLDNQHISQSLKISDKTVRNHVSIILAKLNAKNRAELVAIARDRYAFGRMSSA